MILHATTVAFEGRALLITGASGRGKSSLALQLMAIGAVLVADDRTILTLHGQKVIASCPAPLAGLIEARGVGLLNAPHLAQAPVALVVDLDRNETARLPEQRQITLLGQPLSLVLLAESAHFPSSLRHYVLQGRRG
ncbi:HPr kinase/phosphorylase [Pseudotabrizicola algicola]|nr:HPr kinase/phosphatase C-terminal domain-containing protein [Pseudotabrizicola algicola]